MRKLKEEIKKKIEEALKNCHIPKQFGPLDSDNYTSPMYDFENDFNKSISAHVSTGASKMVVVPQDNEYNVVVKVPFQGSWSMYYDHIDENYKSSFEFFQYASIFDGESWDYCCAEVDAYEKAKEAGVEMFFAETELFCFMNDHPVYLQERCNYNHYGAKKSDKVTADDIEKARALEDEYRCPFYIEWLSLAVHHYGHEKTEKFLQFWKDNEFLTDLHSGNYGYLEEDGRPVLVDYSGWRDCY